MDVVKHWRFHFLEILEHLNYRVENGTLYLKRKYFLVSFIGSVGMFTPYNFSINF